MLLSRKLSKVSDDEVNMEIIGDVTQPEIDHIIKRAKQLHGGATVTKITADGDFLQVEYYLPFERIRRITGYLVGTLDRFNDSKRSEVQERVKHGFDITDEDRFND